MEKSSVGYRGFSSTGPSPVDHKACGNVLSLSRLRTACLGLESRHRKHNPYHQSAIVPNERWDKIKDVDRGTADEVHTTNYAARRPTLAIPHPTRHAPPTITPPSTDLSPEHACGSVTCQAPGILQGGNRGGWGAGRALRTNGYTGPPETRAGQVLPS
ncbi:hypothetical protein THAOC_22884, partial [Thalassiosira oceanica]